MKLLSKENFILANGPTSAADMTPISTQVKDKLFIVTSSLQHLHCFDLSCFEGKGYVAPSSF